MRKILGLGLLGLGGFLLTTALLAMLYVPGKVKVTPLDTDSYTRLTGTATALPSGEGAPLKAVSHTVADGEASDGDVVVFDTFTCLIKDPDGNAPDCVGEGDSDDRLVNASTDRFATDRQTALALNDEKYIGDAEPHDGLINKFPFDVEQKTYPFWDGILGRAVDANFEGEEEVNGLNTYKFVIDVSDEPAEISDGIQGTYSSLKTMWIDPVTGAIMKQHEEQSRLLEDGKPVLDMELEFTDETVQANVDSAEANASKLSLVGKLPLIAGILGLLSVLGGLLLSRGGRDQERDASVRNDRTAHDTRELDVFDSDDEPTRRRSDIHRD